MRAMSHEIHILHLQCDFVVYPMQLQGWKVLLTERDPFQSTFTLSEYNHLTCPVYNEVTECGLVLSGGIPKPEMVGAPACLHLQCTIPLETSDELSPTPSN